MSTDAGMAPRTRTLWRQAIGARLEAARLQRRLTQDEAAILAGVGCQGVVSKVEKGLNLRLETVVALCKLYRVRLDRMVNGGKP